MHFIQEFMCLRRFFLIGIVMSNSVQVMMKFMNQTEMNRTELRMMSLTVHIL